jgi:hypothetical protein
MILISCASTVRKEEERAEKFTKRDNLFNKTKVDAVAGTLGKSTSARLRRKTI